jgi:transposase
MIQAVIERCAGIDVGKTFIVVCVITGPAQEEPQVEVRRFGTFNEELEKLRLWLQNQGCTHVVMESTGSYWKPIFNILEESIEVVLTNAHDVKGRKGHKTDWKDSRWLAHLLRHGMIRPSFIPERGIRELRGLTRRRKQLVYEATGVKNRISKVLEEANVKLGSVLTDIFGVTGRAILLALLEGKTTAAEMAHLAKRKAKLKIPAITASLQNHRLTETQGFLIRQSLRQLDFLSSCMTELEVEIRRRILAVPEYKQASSLLQTIPGIREDAAASIVAEAGVRMEQFPSAKHFCSWVGLCPGNNKSADVEKAGRTTKGNMWLRALMVEVAWAASMKVGSYFRARYLRLIPRTGKKRAVVAVAHSMLTLIYQMLSTNTPYRKAAEETEYERTRQRYIRHHLKALSKLGYTIHEEQLPSIE